MTKILEAHFATSWGRTAGEVHHFKDLRGDKESQTVRIFCHGNSGDA